MRTDTRMVHCGPGFDAATGAIGLPIHLSSTFRQDAPGVYRGYDYARTANPTRSAVEAALAELEGGARGLLFGSGMAALTALFSLLDSGERVVVGDDVYGGTYRVLDKVFKRFGLVTTFVDTTDLGRLEAEMRGARLLLLESPSNPLLRVTDIRRASALAHAHGCLVAVDNTFMTPYLQRPLALGADIVVHSATKYLGGHSDLVAGALVTADEEVGARLHAIENATGGILDPFSSWLLLRGIRTLAVRMERQQANAARIAQWLAHQAWVARVYYPGLAEQLGQDVQLAQAEGAGAIVTFELASAAERDGFVAGLRIFQLAESLGAIESLINVPALMTHASVPAARRQMLGISEGLIRLSVGIEDADDLVEDLDAAAREMAARVDLR
ncbi:MAG: PLP-dependent aspartate aminotransferase family protein [Thermaerobacter sp.]|nr:PLP-dependent aspartate aminotransferase family protein [Thermaerobacter sp.]